MRRVLKPSPHAVSLLARAENALSPLGSLVVELILFSDTRTLAKLPAHFPLALLVLLLPQKGIFGNFTIRPTCASYFEPILPI
jgi:hypothetical protein